MVFHIFICIEFTVCKNGLCDYVHFRLYSKFAPLFSKLRILDIYQINTFETAKFMFGYHNNLLPPLFFNLIFTNIQISHGYELSRASLIAGLIWKKFTIIYQGPEVLNSHPVTNTSRVFSKIITELAKPHTAALFT